MHATIRKLEGCPSSRPPTRAFVAMLLAIGLGGCAALAPDPGGPVKPDDPAGFGEAAPTTPSGFGRTLPPSGIRMRVAELEGGASVTRGGRTAALRKGDSIAVGEPVQVAKGGMLRLNLADQGLLELGSGARLVAYRLPSAALLGARETSLRLENGYLRLVWSEPIGFRNWPIDVSMSRWAAALKPGEYFFEAGADDAVACSTTGEVRLTGNPDTLPDTPGRCVALDASQPARVLEADEQTWAAVRKKASLRSLVAAQTAPAAASASPVATAPPSKGTGKPTAASKAAAAASPQTVSMVVASTTGTATIRRRAGEVALRKGSTVSAGQPIQVGARSRVSLSVPERGWVDLGPSTRFVVHKLPDVSTQGSQETWMRLERGTVRVAVAGTSSTIPPPELSFSRWAAKLGDGEYFIESGKDGATACAAKGDIKLSGVPETLPQAMTQPCVRLRVSQPPVLVTPSETAWTAIRKGGSVEVALAKTVPTIAATLPAPRPPAVTSVPEPARVPPSAPPPVAKATMPAPPPVATPTMPVPPPAATATMPSAPRGVGVNPPRADQPRTEMPTFEAPAPPPSEPPPIAATPPVPTSPASTAPELAMATPPAGTSLPTPSVPDAAGIPPSSPLPSAAPPVSVEQQVPSLADAPAGTAADASMLAMAAPPPGTAPAEWLVNVDAFADPTRAQQLLDVLKGAGYPAALRTQLVQGVPSYRVVIAGLSTETEADGVVSELEQRFELTSAWVLRTR